APTTETFDHAYPAGDMFTWSLPEAPLSIPWPPLAVEVPPVFPAYAGAKFMVDLSAVTPGVAAASPAWPAGVAQPLTSRATPNTTWTQSLPIPLATYEEATVSMVVTQEAVTAAATLSVTATGKAAAGLNTPWNGHYFWFLPLTDLAQQFNTDPQVTIANGGVVFSVPVSFQGEAVVSSFLEVTAFGPTGAVRSVQNQKTTP
ncbi:MAG TPA: hypothetical protein VFQ45_09985, partial [Longimicrobium sp.]|nr:hypothetical protein [Longimicrobium sp.]